MSAPPDPTAATIATITSAIQSAYGRAPTAVELNYWLNNAKAGEPMATIVATIAADGAKGIASVPSGATAPAPSPTSVASPPATALDNVTFINILYWMFFKRAPAPDEVTFYMNSLASGTPQATIFGYFVASPENQVITSTLTGKSTDVANRQTVRNASFTGGSAGFVNSAARDVDNVGAGDASFEWTHLDQLNSAALSGSENVATYSQANGTGTGEVWAAVAEVHQSQDAPAVGLEIDVQKAAGTADGLGLDIVNYGNETAEIQGGDGEIIWRDRTYNGRGLQPLSCIKSLPGGGFAIVVRGSTAAIWP